MKQFKLLKDLPDLKAGAIFKWYLNNGIADLYSCGRYEYTEGFIKSKKDWFEEVNTVEKEERIDVSRIRPHETLKGNGWDSYFYQFCSSELIQTDKFPEIKKAIESVLNGEFWNEIAVALDRYTEERIKYQFASEGKVDNPEPSSKKEEGWEILTCKCGNSTHPYQPKICLGKDPTVKLCEIHSVLRKSDNTVFTVGDETTIGVIKRFEVSEELMYWWNEHTWYYLSQAIEAPTNTAEDKPFVWTDGMVKDFYKYCYNNVFKRPTSPEEMIEEFKKSKTNNQ